jgi:hypothetical protein
MPRLDDNTPKVNIISSMGNDFVFGPNLSGFLVGRSLYHIGTMISRVEHLSILNGPNMGHPSIASVILAHTWVIFAQENCIRGNKQ